jgi:chromosome segregation ATPase
MTEESLEHIIIALITVSSALVASIGVIIAKLLDYKKQIRQLSIVDRSTDDRQMLSNLDGDVGAARQIVEILTSVVNPLTERVKLLEEESINKTKQIMLLNTSVLDLRTLVNQKDMQLARMTNDYEAQLILSEEQSKKIEQQEQKIKNQETRILDLENKIKIMKEQRDGDNSTNC